MEEEALWWRRFDLFRNGYRRMINLGGRYCYVITLFIEIYFLMFPKSGEWLVLVPFFPIALLIFTVLLPIKLDNPDWLSWTNVFTPLYVWMSLFAFYSFEYEISSHCRYL